VELWTVPQGTTRAWRVTLADANGQALSNTYTGTEALALALWVGDDQAATTLATSTAVWASAPDGTITVTLAGADTTALAAGLYRLRLTLTTGGATYVAFEADLQVAASPGSGAALATGGLTTDLMLRLAPWLIEAMTTDPALRSDFSEARNSAWLWYKRQVLARARRDLEDQRRRHAAPLEVTPITPSDGADLGPRWGPSTIPDTTVRDQLATLEGYLDGAKLLAGDGLAYRAMAHYALAEALEPLLGAKDDTPYQTLGMRHRAAATRSLGGHVCQLDSDSDGAADFTIYP
jgi:hypothetical protein